MTVDKYIEMVNLFVSHVNDDEATGDGAGIDGEALIEWYLEQKEDALESEDDYNHERGVAKLVLKKMVKDNILMAVRGEGLREDDTDATADGAPSTSQGVTYVLHPNCALEEY
jgi:DNA replication licensing factor MCM6